ncbi:hypothetical protein [Phascolarctobacterium sp.]
MKTKNIALTLALVTLVSCSNLAFAGFSVPGVGGGATNKQETKSEVKVDLSQLTGQQSKVLKMMAAAMICSAQANMEVNTALGKSNAELITKMNALKQDPIKDNVTNLSKELKKTENTKADFDKLANGSEADKAALKAAMEKASYYKYASYICFGMAIKDASGMMSEASSALKSVKDFGQINQLKGIINTGKMASALYSETQANFKNYDNAAATAKQLLNPNEAKADNAESQKLAENIQDGI